MSIFREYDIRGIFEVDLTKEVVVKIGYLLGERLKSMIIKSPLDMMQGHIVLLSLNGLAMDYKQVD